MKKRKENMNMGWLTPKLVSSVQKVFEPRYRRKLTSFEIQEIARNLTSFIEPVIKFEHEKRR